MCIKILLSSNYKDVDDKLLEPYGISLDAQRYSQKSSFDYKISNFSITVNT